MSLDDYSVFSQELENTEIDAIIDAINVLDVDDKTIYSDVASILKGLYYTDRNLSIPVPQAWKKTQLTFELQPLTGYIYFVINTPTQELSKAVYNHKQYTVNNILHQFSDFVTSCVMTDDVFFTKHPFLDGFTIYRNASIIIMEAHWSSHY